MVQHWCNILDILILSNTLKCFSKTHNILISSVITQSLELSKYIKNSPLSTTKKQKKIAEYQIDTAIFFLFGATLVQHFGFYHLLSGLTESTSSSLCGNSLCGNTSTPFAPMYRKHIFDGNGLCCSPSSF